MCHGSNILIEMHSLFQLTLGQEDAKEGEAAVNRSINHETTSPTLFHSHHHTHCHTHTLSNRSLQPHGTLYQTEPIILREAMRSLMSSINSNHRICHDGDGFLCLFALITGQYDSLTTLVFTLPNSWKLLPLSITFELILCYMIQYLTFTFNNQI